jgi:hypothetical protein
MLAAILTLIWIATAVLVTVPGLEYYALPAAERAHSSLAELWSPTGLWGQGLGIVGSLMMIIGVVGYMIRKRVRVLEKFGALRHWLTVHIFLCTLGPYFVLLHTTFKFGGIISVAFWSMVAVVVSGVFGKYVYNHIPKTLQGRFVDIEQIRTQMRDVAERIQEQTGIAADDLRAALDLGVQGNRALGLVGAMGVAVRSDLRSWKQRRTLSGLLQTHQVPPRLQGTVLQLATRQAQLQRQALLLQPFQRLFHYWHVFHLPFAITMFVILGVHVAVAVAFGYTWIF